MTMPLPDFRQLDKRIDDRLNEILLRCLSRDVNQRYPAADDLLYDLEHYIYHSGYGPTNETLGKLMREIFGQDPKLSDQDAKGSTRLMERTARSTKKISVT